MHPTPSRLHDTGGDRFKVREGVDVAFARVPERNLFEAAEYTDPSNFWSGPTTRADRPQPTGPF